MRKYLIIGTGLALLAGGGVAMAQAPQGGPDGPGPHGPSMEQNEHGNMHRHWDMMEHMRHRPPPPPHGTSFHFRKGDAAVDITCSDNEPVQACVAAAGTLLDKLGGMQPKPTQ